MALAPGSVGNAGSLGASFGNGPTATYHLIQQRLPHRSCSFASHTCSATRTAACMGTASASAPKRGQCFCCDTLHISPWRRCHGSYVVKRYLSTNIHMTYMILISWWVSIRLREYQYIQANSDRYIPLCLYTPMATARPTKSIQPPHTCHVKRLTVHLSFSEYIQKRTHF